MLIRVLAETLNPQLLPKHRAAIEKRVYQMNGEDGLLVGIPDVTVEQRTPNYSGNLVVATPTSNPLTVTVPLPQEFREAYLEIRDITTKQVVTVVEILSPTNKRPGKGRETYLAKRQDVLTSLTHLVEIDLLRAGEPMPIISNSIKANYRILVSRGDRRPRADLYAFNVTEPIPRFELPLKEGDREPMIDLHSLIDQVYDRAGYAVVIDYHQNPIPALPEAENKWLDEYLCQYQMR